MRQIMRVTVGVVGLFNLLLGLGFLLRPALLADKFALAPIGSQGLATIRADFPAFFLTGALFALAGAWRSDPRPLLVPLALLGIAIAGRFASLALDGTPPSAFPPMLAEALMIAVLLVARRSFGGARG